MARELRAEVHKHLVEDLTRLGLPAADAVERERLDVMAEVMIAQTEALSRGFLDGTYKNVDTLVDVLTLEGGLPSG